MRDFFRYQIIEGLLTTGRVPVKELTGRVNQRLKDLGEAEVSKQQIDKDISFMRKRCFAEIQTLRDGVPGYQYAPDSPRIFAANIRQRSKQDESELDFAIAMLDGRANLPLLRRGLDIISRLVNTSFRQRGRNIIMQENHAEEVAGSKWINELYTRITSKEAIVVHYKKFGKEQKKYIISPYMLREYRGLWYLIGYNHTAQEDGAPVIVMAADRIKGLELANIKFFADPEFNASEYFKHSIGIFHPYKEKPKVVRFWASERILNYLKIRNIHPTQRIGSSHVINGIQGRIIQITVLVTGELINHFLEHGTEMRLLDPPELVEKFKIKLDAMRKIYNNPV
jgi:predicted DNA-binding transcriptional regulator YafY